VRRSTCATTSSPPPTREKPFTILLTDRRQLGAPLRVVYRTGKATTEHARLALRFETKREAARWLRALPGDHRIRRLYRTTVDTL
jgi:hypothetical protein